MCTPERPCQPNAPDFCKPNADGTTRCAPPPGCAGQTGGQCAPPPWCTADGDAYSCKTPERPANAPMMQAPPCQPGPDGQLRCAPPPECGGSAFGGAGAAGCAPPDFCKQTDDGNYACKPPQDCRAEGKCFAAASGGACERQNQDAAANGAFVACAAPPSQFCPPPPPGEAPKCAAPPPPPRYCGNGESPFPQDHPANAPPRCLLAPGVANGKYVPPNEQFKSQCTKAPDGEWPPAQPAPAGSFWCPPAGFAPPPRGHNDIGAWNEFNKDHAPAQFANFIAQQGGAWANLTDSQLEKLNNAANAHQLFAPPAFDGRSMNGSFVQSTIGNDLAIRGFVVGGASFFREAKPTGGSTNDFSTSAGPAVLSSGGNVAVEQHNSPTGLLAYKATEGKYDVAFTLEDGYAITQAGNLTILHKGDWKGVLVGDANVTDGAISLAVTPDSPAFFMAIPPGGLEEETRMEIARGIAENKVFAEVSLIQRDETIAQDLTLYQDEGKFSVDVNDATTDAINLTVSGEGEGQAVVFTVDRSTLTTPLSEFNVTMDGVMMTECETFAQLTQSAASGGCFTLHANESTLRVSVMPEHFSTHVISMGSVKAAEPTAASGAVDKSAAEVAPKIDAPGATPTNEAPPTTSDEGTVSAAQDLRKTPNFGVVGIMVAAVGAIGLAALRKKN